MRRLFHFLYHTRDTVYQLMSVDIEYPWPHLSYFFEKKQQQTNTMLIALIKLLIAKTDFTMIKCSENINCLGTSAWQKVRKLTLY